jgi:putative ABC transport system permease protein
VESLFQDIRFGARILRRSFGSTIAVVVALALGIGANSAMFSVVDAVLLHPVRFENPSALALVWDRDPQGQARNVSPASFLDWRAQAKSFSSLAAWAPSSYVLSDGDRPAQITGATVTANFFNTLGVKPILGRTFLPDEDGLIDPSNASRVCVIGYKLWQENLGADPNVLGRTLQLNQIPYAVVGVMPFDFRFIARSHQVWIPVSLNRTSREFRDLTVVGRLNKPLKQASAEMNTLSRSLEQAYPATNRGRSIQLDDLVGYLVTPTFRTRLLLLSAAVGLVLLMACTNVASLLLARAAARNREIAIRISVGATRVRLLRQLLTESLMLALAGGLAGLALARVLIGAAPSVLPANALPTSAPPELNFSVILFTLCVAVATGVLFGVAPALAITRPNVQETLKESSRGSTEGRRRRFFSQAMVTVEVALALMLLVTAGLMIASLQNLTQIDLGFRPQNLLAWSLYLPPTKYDAARALDFHRRVLARVGALPGVESAAVGSTLPLYDPSMEVPFELEGDPPLEESEQPGVAYASLSPEYLQTLGIPIKRGRGFTDADDQTAPPVALVNTAFVERYLANRNPVGQRLVIRRPLLAQAGFGPPVLVEIVGVIGNVKLGRLAAEPTPTLYVPQAQNVWRRISWFALRTRIDPTGLVAAVRHEMENLDSEQPIDQLGTMEQTLSNQFAAPRFQARLMGAFAGLALVLAMVGIYGVNAHAVAQRRHEIGLRMALGATPGRVLRDTIMEGLKLTGYGIVLGLGGALATASVLRSVLVGVSATDPLTIGAVTLFLMLAAAAACYIPAHRATRIDPAIALRQD